MARLGIKKMLALVIVVALSFGVVGCGGAGANVAVPEVTTEVATTEEMDAETLKIKREIEESFSEDDLSRKVTEYVDSIKEEIDSEKMYVDKEDLKSVYDDYQAQVQYFFDYCIDDIGGAYKVFVDDDSYEDKTKCARAVYEVVDDVFDDVYDWYKQGFGDIYEYCDSLIENSEDSAYCLKIYTNTLEGMEKDYNKAKTRLSEDYTLIRVAFEQGNYDVDDILGRTSESNVSDDEEESTTEAKKKTKKKTKKSKKSKKSKKKKKANGVDPDLKKALDEYEAFMDEYCEFMKKYNSSDDVMSMLTEYTSMLSRYSEMTEKINKIDADNLSTADYKYYIDVTSRVSKKLIDAGASM